MCCKLYNENNKDMVQLDVKLLRMPESISQIKTKIDIVSVYVNNKKHEVFTNDFSYDANTTNELVKCDAIDIVKYMVQIQVLNIFDATGKVNKKQWDEYGVSVSKNNAKKKKK
eukprot:250566_1